MVDVAKQGKKIVEVCVCMRARVYVCVCVWVYACYAYANPHVVSMIVIELKDTTGQENDPPEHHTKLSLGNYDVQVCCGRQYLEFVKLCRVKSPTTYQEEGKTQRQ